MRKKKVLLIVLTIMIASVMVLASCANAPAPSADGGSTATEGSSTDSDSSGDSGGEAATKDVKLALVIHALNSSFFAKIGEGAEMAGKDLGIDVTVMAPATPNQLTEQVNMIESSIAGGFDGIATTLWDPDGFNAVIKKAQDQGIMVMGFNQDSPDSGRTAFIGQENEAAGYMMGKYMFGTVMGGEGSYIIANCAPANTALIARREGIQRAQLEYPNIEFLAEVDIGTDLTSAVGVVENAYIAYPEVNAFLGVDVYSEAIGTFIATQNLNGQVYGAGFDLTEGTLKHVKDNAMQLTIGQNPFLQGYYPMVQMFLSKMYGTPLIDMDTGALLVTAENVDEQQPE